jgi:uncharacterized cupredoxin-like copper-binding protein
MQKSFRTRAGALAMVALVGLGAAACGDDDDTETAAGENPAPTAEAPEENTSGRFCAGIAALDATPPPDGPGADPSQYLTSLKPIAAELKESAPESVADAATKLDEIVNAQIGPAGPDVQGLFAASAELHTVVADECDFETVEVKGIDYGFEGVPTELEAGQVNFAFENVSNREMHEMVLFKKKDGVTQSVQELMAEGDAAFAKIEMQGVAFAEPGKSGGIVVDLEAGDYGMICFIPVGGAENAPPHAAHGMVTEFSVK